MRSSLTFLCCIVLLSQIAVNSNAEDWPRFRGLSGLGVSQSQGLPTEIGPQQHVLWKQKIGKGTASPVVVANRLYLASYEENTRTLECLDAVSGKQVWIQSVPKLRDENSNMLNGPATCTPAIDGDNVVVFFPDTALLCYSTDGQLRWRAEVGPYYSMHGISHSPVIADGKVLLLADQLKDSHITAYNLADGKPAWRRERASGVTGGYSTPTILRQSNRKPLVLTSGPGGLEAYDLASGESAFSVPGIANAPVTIPLLQNKRVILCEPVGEAMPISMMLPPYDKNKDGKLSFKEAGEDVAVLRLLERIERGWGNGDEIIEAAEWNKAFQSFVDKGGLVAVDVINDGETSKGKIAWNYRKGVPYVATPVLYDGLLYMVNNGGVVTVVDPSDGSLVLEKRLRKGGKQFYASPVAADGKIYLVDTDGQLSVLQAGRTWNELHTVNMDEPCMATPAICDGRIYLRTASHLYCFGL